jgi:hypothetical protein
MEPIQQWINVRAIEYTNMTIETNTQGERCIGKTQCPLAEKMANMWNMLEMSMGTEKPGNPVTINPQHVVVVSNRAR